MHENDYDLLIVGGGLAGISLSVMLAMLPFKKIGILEANAATNSDQRPLALSLSSQKILNTLGLWEKIAKFATPIQHVHISNQGRFPAVHLNASEQKLAAYGYVVASHQLMQILKQTLKTYQQVEYIAPAQLQAIQFDDSNVTLTVKTAEGIEKFRSKLTIGADGNHSKLRELLNIPTRKYDYQQRAIVATLALAREHGNCAFERFTGMGTLAMLPLSDRKCTLVWTADNEDAEKLLNLSDADFVNSVQQQFGYRLGRLNETGPRISYPLQLIEAKECARSRTVLMGNAAHNLHPIGAQGFNLGLRDAALFAEIIADTLATHGNLCTFSALNDFQQRRIKDHKRTEFFAHNIAKLFSQSFFADLLVKDLGLFGLNMLPLLKNKLTQQGMGLMGRLPKLVCGIPL